MAEDGKVEKKRKHKCIKIIACFLSPYLYFFRNHQSTND